MSKPAAKWWLVVYGTDNDSKYAIFDDREWAQKFAYMVLSTHLSAEVYPCLTTATRDALKGLLT